MASEDLTHAQTREAVDIIAKKTRQYKQAGKTTDILTVDNHVDGVYLYLKLKQGRSTFFGFADGHAGKRSWQSQGLVDWCFLAIDYPGSFAFYRNVPAGDVDEAADWNWAVEGYAYKSLTGPIYRP